MLDGQENALHVSTSQTFSSPVKQKAVDSPRKQKTLDSFLKRCHVAPDTQPNTKNPRF